MSNTLTYDSDRLIRQWRERYAAKRSTNQAMLDEAEMLVRDAIAQERAQEVRQAKSDKENDLERREMELKYTIKRYESQVANLRLALAEKKAEVDRLSTRATLMREERETVEDGTVVRLVAPTVPLYRDSDRTAPRPWMLSELEDVLLRLRMAGGVDTTEVRFKRDSIEACLPFPEVALMPITSPAPKPAARAHRINPVAVLMSCGIVAAFLLAMAIRLLG